jgi:hypothetical protein
MARKLMLLAAFISLLVILALPGIFVNLSEANPFAFRIMDEVPPDNKTEPPTILILSPENNTSHAADDVVFSLKVDVGYSATATPTPAPFLLEVYYEADWKRGFTYVYDFDDPIYGSKTLAKFNTTIALTGIPEGNRILTVYAVEKGRYEKTVPDSNSSRGYLIEYYPFKIADSSSTHFTVDATPPNVSVLSVENGTLDASKVQVGFVVDEPVQNVSYVLDEQRNMTVAGNFTLSGLSSGVHSLTVYATDDVGNVGASETINFTVAAPPTLSPSPTTSPSVNPSQSPANEEPQVSPPDSQAAALPSEIVYASAGVAVAVAGVAAAAVYFIRRQSTQTTLP